MKLKRLIFLCVALCIVLSVVPESSNAEKREPRLLKTVTVGDWYEEYDDSTVITVFNYNDRGQLVQELSYYYLDGRKTIDREVQYQYHKNGTVKTIHAGGYPVGIYESHFDSSGHRMEGICDTPLGWFYGLPADEAFLNAKYDGDNLVSATTPYGDTYYYHYDKKGRVSSVTSTDERWLDQTFSYSENGNYTIYGGKRGEDRYTEGEYRSDGKILRYLEIVKEDGEERVTTDLEWTYDQEGNEIKWYGLWWGDTPQDWAVNEHEYQYRADGKLKVETIDGTNIRTYYYDDESEDQANTVSGTASGVEFTGSLSDYRVKYFYEASATSELQEGDLRFIADYAINRDLYYPWVEGVKGSGIGESITMRFREKETIELLGLRLGYAATQELFEDNNRPSRLLIEFSDGSSFEYYFEDDRSEQIIELGGMVETEYVKLTILDVYPGSRCDDTCIYLVRAFS